MIPISCPNFSLIVWKREAGRVVMSRIRCKSWQCEYCAKKNREMWRSHLKKRICAIGGQWWFITVTAAEWYRERAKSLENLRRGLNLLLKRINRVFGKVEYVRVYELHKKGAFHAHLIMSSLSGRVHYRRARSGQRVFKPAFVRGLATWTIQTWFKKTCRTLKLGYMVDVQRIEGVQKAVNYISKYITKEGQNFSVRGLRRIQTSSAIGAANGREAGKGWVVGKHVWGGDVGMMPLYDANLKITINPSYWNNEVVYPPERAKRSGAPDG